MKRFLTRWGRLAIASAFLAAAVHSIVRPHPGWSAANPVRDAGAALLRPVFGAAAGLTRAVSSLWSRYVALVGVARENEALRREVILLRQRLQETRDAALENRRLKELLRFAERVEPPTVGARVVGHDLSPWFQALFIDAGSEAGVAPGMAVVTPLGGVGRVGKVARGLSSVILASDGRFAADVIVERTRVRAVAEGMGGNYCRLKYVTPTQDVAVGDRVVFSGFDGSMPRGTPLGTVVAVDRPREGLFQKVTVATAVNLQAVEEVLVVLARPSIPFGTAGE